MSDNRFSLLSLKEYYDAHNSDWPSDDFRLRIHRALSWLEAAGQFDNPDARFIFYWVAFNSAYAKEITDEERASLSERKQQRYFFENILQSDQVGDLKKTIVDSSGPIKKLINNPYVYKKFWDCQRNASDGWETHLDNEIQAAMKALYSGDRKVKILRIIFDRLYMLRNQLMHGGATWNSSANREQVRDGVYILKKIVPRIIYIMVQNPEKDWGTVAFPYIPGRDGKKP